MEKFALKITMRGPKDVHCKRVFTEKDIMLALEPSPWHIKLVVNFIILFCFDFSSSTYSVYSLLFC